MKSLVIGRGQIGQAVIEVISRKDVITTFDKKDGGSLAVTGIEVLHICFPCTNQDEFVKAVNEYVKQFQPWHVIIWSTVPIGTTKLIKGAVHSPVEGVHPKLANSIRSMVRWIGANDEVEGEFFEGYFKDLWLKTEVVDNSDFTEFLKLRSTSKYGINIVWAYYEAQVSKQLGMDYELVKQFDQDYNRLYHNLGMNWAQRYILKEPTDKIGGHCVVPNAELLDEQFPSELLKLIKGMK